MQLNLVMTILDRERIQKMEKVIQSLRLPFSLTILGRGTATIEHLSLYNLAATEKALISTVADGDQTQHLMRAAKRQLFLDIPGNGIMLAAPIKSVGGGRTMALLTDNKTPTGGAPSLNITHELIIVILNEGYSDMVMEAARPAGASGGTVLSGKGTGAQQAETFLGITLANEKDLVLIVAPTDKKNAIMQAIMEHAGVQTPAGSLCFSLPVTQVVGLRSEDIDN